MPFFPFGFRFASMQIIAIGSCNYFSAAIIIIVQCWFVLICVLISGLSDTVRFTVIMALVTDLNYNSDVST